MKPTVGRMVYYRAYGTPGGEFPSVERAAIITDVHEGDPDEAVSLCVLNPTGMYFSTHIKRGQRPGRWDWMPFQKGQAQRSEELEKALRQQANQELIREGQKPI